MEDLVDIFKRNDYRRGSILEEIEAEKNNRSVPPKHLADIDFLDYVLDYNGDNVGGDPFNDGYASVHGEDEYLDNLNKRLNGRTIEESPSACTRYCDHRRCGYVNHRS
ncbi:hypothetical protein ISS04_02625 [Candidatus Woesearchaeota archaeon]|nr:hypothetical protein [Candidatus Woesearchaeota archaeon]